LDKPTGLAIHFPFQEKLKETKGGDLLMAKVLRCSDVGFECEGVIRAETEEEVMQQAAEHAKTAHDVQELTDEIVQKVKAAIQDE